MLVSEIEKMEEIGLGAVVMSSVLDIVWWRLESESYLFTTALMLLAIKYV